MPKEQIPQPKPSGELARTKSTELGLSTTKYDKRLKKVDKQMDTFKETVNDSLKMIKEKVKILKENKAKMKAKIADMKEHPKLKYELDLIAEFEGKISEIQEQIVELSARYKELDESDHAVGLAMNEIDKAIEPIKFDEDPLIDEIYEANLKMEEYDNFIERLRNAIKIEDYEKAKIILIDLNNWLNVKDFSTNKTLLLMLLKKITNEKSNAIRVVAIPEGEYGDYRYYLSHRKNSFEYGNDLLSMAEQMANPGFNYWNDEMMASTGKAFYRYLLLPPDLYEIVTQKIQPIVEQEFITKSKGKTGGAEFFSMDSFVDLFCDLLESYLYFLLESKKISEIPKLVYNSERHKFYFYYNYYDNNSYNYGLQNCKACLEELEHVFDIKKALKQRGWKFQIKGRAL